MRPRDLLLGILALMVAAGCGGDKGAGTRGSDDRRRIAELLSDFEELPTRPKEFNASFLSGAPSAGARQKYVGNVYRLSGSPTFNGDTATARVLIQKVNTGTWLGEATWEFAKVGDTWKIKSAPIP